MILRINDFKNVRYWCCLGTSDRYCLLFKMDREYKSLMHWNDLLFGGTFMFIVWVRTCESSGTITAQIFKNSTNGSWDAITLLVRGPTSDIPTLAPIGGQTTSAVPSTSTLTVVMPAASDVSTTMIFKVSQAVGSHLLNAWRRYICDDPWILNIVNSSYEIKFFKTPFQVRSPPACVLDNEKSALCDQEVFSLLEKKSNRQSHLPLWGRAYQKYVRYT